MLFPPQFLKCIPLFFLTLIATHTNSINASNYGFFEDLESRKRIDNPFEFKDDKPILATQSESYNEVHQHQCKPPLSKKSSYHSFVFAQDTKIYEEEIMIAEYTDNIIRVDSQQTGVVESMLQPENKKRKRLSIVAQLSKFFCYPEV